MTSLATGLDERLMTALGPFETEVRAIPGGLPELVRVIQGLVLHVFWAERYGVSVPEERKAELEIRPARAMLARARQIDPRPLEIERPPEGRLLGNCRDFSVLLAAFLQARGVRARARCGFGTYFLPNHYEDHWVCEYHDGRRWILVDAQLDQLQQRVLAIDFDPLDVPRDRFIMAGEAWLECLAGRRDPEAHGILDMHGLWFIRGNVVRDALSLLGLPVLPWDVWGLIGRRDAEDVPECRALTTALAEACVVNPPDLERLRALVLQHASELLPPEPLV